MAPYFLSLNKSAIIVVTPPNKSSTLEDIQNDIDASHSEPVKFVQVFIGTSVRPSVDVLAAFFLAQADITRVIESLAIATINDACDEAAILAEPTFVLQGDGFTLLGKRHAWPYGQKWLLGWGEEDMVPCEHKWVFTFEVTQLD
ncbi:hypothetical protein PLICRDRAFT_54846 [Plicaturopsis crispa FD-325 SS-3]|nr:hypothetical protein PLICRDRAFT_54846 [Plicaturopsis crispa FD-325 SS-3]